MRWTKGNIQVCRKYGTELIKSIFKNRSFSSFDMTMSIFAAFTLTAVSVAVNLFGFVYGLLLGRNLMIILVSIWKSIVNAYLMFFAIGLITTISEWKKIFASPAEKIVYAFTIPIFMFTYIPITIAAIFKKVEWKQIEHSKSITLKEIRMIKSKKSTSYFTVL